MKINDLLYHPCSLDIIEFRINKIHTIQDENSEFTTYTAKSTDSVGACGRIEVLLTVDIHGVIRFYDLVEDYEYSRGLHDCIEGYYFTTKSKARLEYYKIQETLSSTNVDSKKRLYEEAQTSHNRVKQILKEIREELKDQTCKSNQFTN